MELQLYSIILISLLLVLVAFLKYPGTKSKKHLPPGPWKLPIIGSLHHLISGHPHRTLRDLAVKHGPIMHLQLGEVSAVIVSSSEMAKEVLQTHDLKFVDRPVISVGKIVFYDSSSIGAASYGNYWRQLKKICTLELLSAKRVQSFRSLREKEVSKLIGSISASICGAGVRAEVRSVNVSELIFSVTNDIVARAAFGEKFEDKHALLPLLHEVIILGAGFDVANLFPSRKYLSLISGMKPRLVKMHKRIDSILDNIIKNHKEIKSVSCKGDLHEDLVHVLLRLQKDGSLDIPITTNNIKAVILDILIAGTDTSSTVVEWVMTELMRNPREMKKVQTEIRHVFEGKLQVEEIEIHKLSYLKSVIKETIRLHPPAPLLIPRECREQCAIDGYEIPKKTKVFVNAWAIGRDPRYWKNAEAFEPARFDNSDVDYKGTNFEFLPFGAGRRICPGISFGMADVDLLLAQLLYHFDWNLPGSAKAEEIDMTDTFGAVVKKRNDLYLVPTMYSNLPAKKMLEI